MTDAEDEQEASFNSNGQESHLRRAARKRLRRGMSELVSAFLFEPATSAGEGEMWSNPETRLLGQGCSRMEACTWRWQSLKPLSAVAGPPSSQSCWRQGSTC